MLKYLKTYNQLHEGLRDKMVGKSYDNIINDLKNLPLGELKSKFISLWYDKSFTNDYNDIYEFLHFVKKVTDVNLLEEFMKKIRNKYPEENYDEEYVISTVDEEILFFSYKKWNKKVLIDLILKLYKEKQYITESLRDKMVGKDSDELLHDLKDIDMGKLLSIAYDSVLKKFYGNINDFIKHIEKSDFLDDNKKNKIIENYKKDIKDMNISFRTEMDILITFNKNELIEFILSLY